MNGPPIFGHIEGWASGPEKPTGPAIVIDDGDWIEAEIPQRPWLAKGYLLRGAVTVISGPGSAGKSSLMIGWCVAMALGRRYGGFEPVEPLRVLTYNVEDDAMEQRRRLSATLRQFDAHPKDLGKNVVRLAPVGVGTLIQRDDLGRLSFTRAMDAIEAEIEARRPHVVILDPLVELHDSEENDNTALRAVLARFRGVAAQHDIAVGILHHARKGASASPGDPDTLRGASAIVGAARIVLTLSVMTSEEAQAVAIPEHHRNHYFRLDGAKSNYAPLHEADWFERVAYDLDNGEQVAAAVPWTPPSKNLDLDTIDAIVSLVSHGTPSGLPLSERLSDNEPRSIAHGLEKLGIVGRAAQKEALRQALATRRIVVALFRRVGKSKDDTSRGLRCENGLPSGVEWVS